MRIRKFGWLWKKETRETKKKGGGKVKEITVDSELVGGVDTN